MQRTCRKRKIRQKNKKSQEYTAVYRDHFLTGLLNKTPDEVPEYIVKNYIVIPENKKNPQRIQIESEERTAKKSMIEIIEQLDLAYWEQKWDYNDIKQFLEMEKSSKKEREKLEDQMKEEFLSDQNRAFDDVVFQWDISLEFEKNFPNKTEILSILKKIEERLNRTTDPFQRVWRDRVLSVLHILARPQERTNKQSLIAFADSPEYFSKSMLQTRLEKLGIVSEGSQILDALKMLSDMGYDIVRKEKGTVYYSLGKRAYDDEMLQKFLTKCQKIYYDITDEDRALFLKAMLRKHKITRSELLSWHFSVYCSNLDINLDSETEYEKLNDFPAILLDYQNAINPILIEARYQPLNEKNILDIYVMVTLYFYTLRRQEPEDEEM